tara:strand:- start:7743 stop:7931 length:189 start_codon:yes stop_codon:yes gene_type:complete
LKIYNMKLNHAAWQDLKDRIEVFLDVDPNITDVIINYQVKESKKGNKNFLKMDYKIDKNLIK